MRTFWNVYWSILGIGGVILVVVIVLSLDFPGSPILAPLAGGACAFWFYRGRPGSPIHHPPQEKPVYIRNGTSAVDQIKALQSALPRHTVYAELRALHIERPLTSFDTTRAPGGPTICDECETTYPCNTIEIVNKGA
jgi:hypothetical protein